MLNYLKKFIIIIFNLKRVKLFKTKLEEFVFLINFFFKKRKFKLSKIYKINHNLVLISQIQRSGGSLLSQLFDGHSKILAYPSELILTDPKWDWTKKFIFYCFKQQNIKKYSLNKNYNKPGSIKWNKKYYFNFNLFLQKKIFDEIKKKDLRLNFDAYFTSFFNSYLNYKDKKKFNDKKIITAFLPRLNFKKKNIKIFFQLYPEGKIISIIREPHSWLASATKHSSTTYANPNKSLTLWLKSAIFLYENKNKDKNILLLTFEELVRNTPNTMKKILKFLDLKFEPTLLVPTFNGKKILSDSSFKLVEGKIDKDTINRKLFLEKKIFDKVDKKLLKECKLIYKKIKSRSKYNNSI